MKLKLTIALLFVCASAIAQQPTPPAVQQAAKSTVIVHQPPYAGTGCVINTTGTRYAGTKVIVTAWHVVADNPNNVSIEFQGSSKRYRALVICKHPTADTAIVQLRDGPNVSGVYLAQQQPSRVYWIGFSYRGPLAFHGRIVQSQADWCEVIGSSVEGQSGGPAFSAQGELVANVYARTAEGPQRMVMTNNRAVKGMAYKHFGTVFSRQTAERIQFPGQMNEGVEYPAGYAGQIGEGALQPIGGQGCQPGFQSPRPMPYPLPPGFQPIDVQPLRPIQKPQNPCPPQQIPITIDYDKLAAAMPKPKDGRNGVDGQQGSAGPQGPPGQQGPPGKDAQVNEQAIVDAVLAQIPYDQLGQQIGDQVYAQIKADPQFQIDEDKLLARLKAQLPSVTIDLETDNGVVRRIQNLADGDAYFKFKFDAGSIQVAK